MTKRYLPLLVTLSLVWGASYLFIKVGVRELAPTTMMLARVVIAAVALVGVLRYRGQLGALRRAPIGAYVLGLFNSAIPFTLIAWGERHITSGLAGVINASLPIFVALLAIRFRPSERPRGLRIAGVLLGVVGVGILTGAQPGAGWWALAGALAVVLASLSYGISSLYGQHLVERVSGPVLSTAALLGASVPLLPIGIAEAPAHMPSLKAVGCVLALSLLGTAFAQLIWFRLLRLYGSARASLVTYLMPVTALLYGVVLLNEPVSAGEIVGLALILAGVALAGGVARLPRRRPLAAAQPSA